MENNKNPLGLRKGAWTKEEDDLLRQCIQKYGEGRWHQVPLRAGLNRCRKSCRLRWLNYLRPNIKRGFFNEDEVDLIIRLHKLLGNRWSLIAGRIPGRTANDVKNFWNTRMEKKPSHNKNSNKDHHVAIKDHHHHHHATTNIIKPRPRTFLFKPPTTNNDLGGGTRHHEPPSQQQLKLQDNESIRWWRNLLEEAATDDHNNLLQQHYRGDEDEEKMSFFFPCNNYYYYRDHEDAVADKMLWSGPYGNDDYDHNTSSCHLHADSFDFYGGIIGGGI